MSGFSTKLAGGLAGPLTRPLTSPGGGGGGGWNPLKLFGGGEDGFDFRFYDTATLFQDASGTTPAVAADDPIRLVRDNSGNGTDATAPSDTTRPLLKQDGGIFYAAPDGSDDYMTFAQSLGTGPRTLWFVGEVSIEQTGTRYMISSASGQGFVARYQNEYSYHNTEIVKAGVLANTRAVVIAQADGEKLSITVNGVTTTVASTNTAGTISRLFAHGNGTNPMSGRCYAAGGIARSITDTEREKLTAWGASVAGLVPVLFPLNDAPFDGVQSPSLSHTHGASLARLNSWLAAGYTHLAPGNYYPSDPSATYPLTNMQGVTEADIPDGVVGAPNAEHFGFTDATGHVGAVGCALATGSAEGGSNMAWRDFIDAAEAEFLFPEAGGFIINHPTLSYPGTAVAKQMLDYSRRTLGIEVFNYLAEWNYGGTGYAFDKWHELLAAGWRCFGFAAPDHFEEGMPEPVQGFNMLLLPAEYSSMSDSEKEQAALEAYFKGHLYMKAKLSSPTLVSASASASGLIVEFAEPCSIRFHFAKWGDATYTATEPVIGTTATFNRTGGEAYVYAVAEGDEGEVSITQPVNYLVRP